MTVNPFSSALALAQAIRTKELSPVEVVDHYLARIDQLNPELNAVTWRRDDDVRREAKQAEDALMRGEVDGAFFGVPIAIKDLIFVEGWPISYGSKAGLGHIATWTSDVISAFQRAGFLLLCRTNTPEFGIMPVTENAAYGATRNPWDPSRTSGGSSGGSSSAVASGMAPIAHASDGGGSIRIPASCTGLVGLKPSRGRVGNGPLVSDIMGGGATEGCLSRTVADTAAVLDLIASFDPGAWYNAPRPERRFSDEVMRDPGRLRIGFTSTSPIGNELPSFLGEKVRETATMLENLGHEVFEAEVKWPDSELFGASFLTVWNTGSSYWTVEDESLIEPLSAAMLQAARDTDSVSYVRALAGLQIMTRELLRHWQNDFDVLMTPTLANEPPKVGSLYENTDSDPLVPIIRASALTPFTPIFNATGQPGISLPIHWSESGLPIGMQFVARPWEEATLIRLASQLEAACGWPERHP